MCFKVRVKKRSRTNRASKVRKNEELKKMEEMELMDETVEIEEVYPLSGQLRNVLNSINEDLLFYLHGTCYSFPMVKCSKNFENSPFKQKHHVYLQPNNIVQICGKENYSKIENCNFKLIVNLHKSFQIPHHGTNKKNAKIQKDHHKRSESHVNIHYKVNLAQSIKESPLKHIKKPAKVEKQKERFHVEVFESDFQVNDDDDKEDVKEDDDKEDDDKDGDDKDGDDKEWYLKKGADKEEEDEIHHYNQNYSDNDLCYCFSRRSCFDGSRCMLCYGLYCPRCDACGVVCYDSNGYRFYNDDGYNLCDECQHLHEYGSNENSGFEGNPFGNVLESLIQIEKENFCLLDYKKSSPLFSKDYDVSSCVGFVWNFKC